MPAVSSTLRVPPSSPGSSHELQAPQATPTEEQLAHKPRSHPLQHPQSDPAPLHNQSIPTSPPLATRRWAQNSQEMPQTDVVTGALQKHPQQWD